MKANVQGRIPLITLIIITIISSGCTRTISIESLLQEMTDRSHLTYFPEPYYRLKQSSSYNRETVEPGNRAWFANADCSHFIRVDSTQGRREFVMFDEAGPGAIVRWWMTFWRAENGIVRVYIDGDPSPVIEGHPFRVISGGALAGAPFSQWVPLEAPEHERGHNLYLPIPYSGHCTITYECDSLIEKENHYFPDVFYNICYREYGKGTRVLSYTPDRLEKAKHTLKVAGDALLADFSPGRVVEAFNLEIPPGDSLVIPIEKEDAAISYLCLHPHSPNPEQALRSTVLTLEFDGHRTVWVPVGEFFGTGYKLYPHKTLYSQTTSGGEMRSSWIMPFREQCRVCYINFGNDTIRLKGEIGLTEYFWNTRSMYFGASWHEYHHLETRKDGWFFDVNYVDIKGKGCYVGDQVTLFNMAHTWWGEGDEKIFVDGEPFPSSIGTGSEDYYGYAFARPEPFSHPFISQPTGAGNFDPELTVNMRHRGLDAIPFTTSVSSNIELWHWASTAINYAMTAYFYVLYPYEINVKPDIEAVRRPVVLKEEDFFTPAASHKP